MKTSPYKARRARREWHLPPWWAILAVAAASLIGGGGTAALWSQSTQGASLKLTPAVAGFSVQRSGGDADVATGPTQSVGYQLTAADAIAVDSAQAIAVPFLVRLMTSGTAGMNYTVTVGTPAAGSLLAAAQITAFPQGSDGCTVTASPGSVPTDLATGAYIGVAPTATPRPVGTPAGQAWCLVIKFKPGSYTNSVTASGTHDGSGDPVSAADSWSAVVGADPTAQTPVDVTLTHTTTSFGGS